MIQTVDCTCPILFVSRTVQVDAVLSSRGEVSPLGRAELLTQYTGRAVRLVAWLEREHRPVVGGEVAVTVTGPDNTTSIVTLRDTGLGDPDITR